MANEQLKNALGHAGLQPDDLAELIEVDVKTVRRWLYGNLPYPRHRTRIARALDTPELELWPELTATPPAPATTAPAASDASADSDLIAAYPTRSHPAAPDPLGILQAAQRQIDISCSTLKNIAQTPGMPRLLHAKALLSEAQIRHGGAA